MFKTIRNIFLAELSNWILWLVVFFAAGIGFYFSLDKEPDLHSAFFISLFVLTFIFLFRKRKVILFFLLPIFFFSFGMTIATWRTHSLASEKLTKQIKNARIYGVVEKIFPSKKKSARLILNVKRVYADEKISLKKLQVMTMNFNSDVKVGDFISLYASISPPSQQLFPNSYDFARHAYFNRIGGNAFSISKIRIVEPARDDSLSIKIENLRLKIFRILITELGAINGSIAAALMVGEQKAINQKVLQDMRYSGLTHIIAISGLHMSLVAIICFFVIRHLLSYSLYITQQYNTKKIAACASLVLSFCYLLISGTRVAAVRSFVMLAVLMASILIDRQNSPKRSVFLAAFLILLFSPESIFHPGFQMSFAAVVALIGIYEIYSKKVLSTRNSHSSIFKKIKFYFLGVLVSSAIAGTATSIFVMHHFHNYSNYSIAANLLAAPIVSFIVMPGVVLTFFLMLFPFGVYKLGAYILGFGITLMLKIASGIAALPTAIFITPTTHIIVPILFTAGMLWLCIWEKRWRVFGLIPMIISFVIIFSTPFPDIIIDKKYKAVLINNEDKRNALTQLSGVKRISKFHKTQWFNLLDTNQKTIIAPAIGINKIIKKIYKIKSTLRSFPNMCIRNRDKKELVKLTITNMKTHDTFVIFREDVEEHGAHFIYLNKDKIKIEHSINKNISRPWTV